MYKNEYKDIHKYVHYIYLQQLQNMWSNTCMVMNEKKFLIWSIILVYSLFGREILLKPELYNTDRYMYMYVGLTFAVYHS